MDPLKTKIVFAENDFMIGGVQRLAIDQLEFIDRGLFKPYLIVLKQFPNKSDFYDLVPNDVEVYKLDFKSLFDAREWIKLYGILRKIKPDIVKTSLFFSNTVFRVIKVFLRYKTIQAEHNTGNKKKLHYRIVDRILAPLSKTIVADSQMVADFVSKTEGISRSKFTVIYNGVDLAGINSSIESFGSKKNEIKKELGVALDDIIFLSVARIVTQKNHDLMVEAFYNLCKIRNDCKLVIVGGGSLEQKILQKIMALDLASKVLMLGERKDVHRFYSISDFFVLTSKHEGFCIAAMEGLAFGLPLISTRVAGVSEYLEDGVNGFFMDGDAADVCKKMESLASMPPDQLTALKQVAVNTAKGYSVDRYMQSYKKLFLSCINRED